MLFDATAPDTPSEYKEQIVVQCENGEFEIPIRSSLVKANVRVNGNANFGTVALESKATRTIQLVNHGEAVTSFQVCWWRGVAACGCQRSVGRGARCDGGGVSGVRLGMGLQGERRALSPCIMARLLSCPNPHKRAPSDSSAAFRQSVAS